MIKDIEVHMTLCKQGRYSSVKPLAKVIENDTISNESKSSEVIEDSNSSESQTHRDSNVQMADVNEVEKDQRQGYQKMDKKKSSLGLFCSLNYFSHNVYFLDNANDQPDTKKT